MKNATADATTILAHAGYFGSIESDLENGTLHGTVQGLRDVVTYEAKTLPALVKAFRGSVNDYLAYCEERGEQPDRPYSGKFGARLTPEMHRQAAALAEIEGVSLNDLVARALEREIATAAGRSPAAAGA